MFYKWSYSFSFIGSVAGVVLSTMLLAALPTIRVAAQGQEEGPPLVLTTGQWTVLSPEINHFTAITAGRNGETWIGTPLGVKRITPKGIRFYTTRDGLPEGTVSAITVEAGGEKGIWCAVAQEKTATILVSRFDAKRDRWITLPALRNVPAFLPARELSLPPKILLAASPEGEVYATIRFEEQMPFGSGFSKNGGVPATAFWHFDRRERRWEAIPVLKEAASRRLSGVTFLQETPDQGLFVGTTTGFFRWGSATGWAPLLKGEAVGTGVRGANGDWWLTGNHPQSFSSIAIELLHIDKSGAILSRAPFPTSPLGRSRNPELRDITLTLSSDSHVSTLWATGVARNLQIIGDVGGMRSSAYLAGFAVENGASVRALSLEGIADLTDVPNTALIPFMIRSSPEGVLEGLQPEVSEAIKKRFVAYDSPLTKGTFHIPEFNSFPPSRGEAGTDPDGKTWDRNGDNAMIRLDAEGKQELFPLPELRLPISGDLCGVAVTGEGALLTVTNDSLLRHPAGTPNTMDSWQRVEVPMESANGSWMHYGYGTRLCVHEGGFWIATDAFAVHYDAQGRVTSPLTRDNGTSLQLLGVRKDGTAWVHEYDAGVALIGTDGKPVRQLIVPSPTTSPITPFREVGGALGDLLWYTGDASTATGEAYCNLQGYDTRTEKWTPPLSCDRVIALRSGVDEDSSTTSRDTVWALIDKANEAHLAQWNPATGAWADIGPALPKEAGYASTSLRIIRARSNDIWVADRDRIILYHWDGHTSGWTSHPVPPGSGLNAGNAVADAGVYATQSIDGVKGPIIYLAGITGLWEYSVDKAVWRRQPVPSLGQWWVSRVANGGPNTAWAVLIHPATGSYAGARFDKKTHTWTIYGETEGFPRQENLDNPLIPDTVDPAHSCWLLARNHLYRFAKGRWSDRTKEVTGGDPAIAVDKIVPDPSGDAWLVIGKAAQQVPVAQQRAPGVNAPLVVRWRRKSDSFTRYRPLSKGTTEEVYGTDVLPEASGDVILGTTSGAFRLKPGGEQWAPLEIPAFPNLSIYNILQNTEGLWFVGEGVYAVLRSNR